jgi:hypothetical protein
MVQTDAINLQEYQERTGKILIAVHAVWTGEGVPRYPILEAENAEPLSVGGFELDASDQSTFVYRRQRGPKEFETMTVYRVPNDFSMANVRAWCETTATDPKLRSKLKSIQARPFAHFVSDA